jgi:DNA-binding GntR family transcriptional regulator
MSALPWPSSLANSELRPDAALPLAHRVRQSLLTSILKGEFAPGDRITEPELAHRLQVSRVPVREALRELESIGLLESRKHTGVFVRRLGLQETLNLYELRSLLEAHACRVAAQSRQPSMLKSLKQQLRQMDQAAKEGDLTSYYNGNLAFHWEIVSHCGNDEIASSYRAMVQKLHVARLRNLSSPQAMQASQSEHTAILQAIELGQADDAYRLAYAHVTSAGQRFLGAQ